MSLISSIRSRSTRDDGVTLIELLVTMGLFGILMTVLASVMLNSAANVKTARQTTDMNEESRLVLNRMSRELRESTGILEVVNPDGSNYNSNSDVSIRFAVDFNGDGVITQGGDDPEELVYEFQKTDRRLVLKAPPDTTALPILAANVEAFKVSYRSSDYRCDSDSNGEVTWQELEVAPNPCPESAGQLVGGVSALDVEKASIDSIIIELTVLTGARRQEYRTKLDLRNKI